MDKVDRLGWADGFSTMAYGLRIGFRSNQPEIFKRLPAYLPPGFKFSRARRVDRMYSLLVGENSPSSRVKRFSLLYGDWTQLARTHDLQEALDALENDLQMTVAEFSPQYIFVHAGVVGWHGKAIVLPGRTHTGKSTLVKALVDAGATYYSDEYALMDAEGRVHPYRRPMSLRQANGERPLRVLPETTQGNTSAPPLPVGLVAVTEYRSGARWRPKPLTAGQAALALLSNTVPARVRPADSLNALRRMTAEADLLTSRRGQAEQTAPLLLKML